jgi:hypothetical protein
MPAPSDGSAGGLPMRTVVVSRAPSAASDGRAGRTAAVPAAESAVRKRRRVCIIGIGNLPFFVRAFSTRLSSLKKRQSVFLDDRLRFRLDQARFMQPQRAEPHRVFGIVLPLVVRDLVQSLQGTDQGARRRAALGHGRRFGTTHACFSTATVSRPSAGAIGGRAVPLEQAEIS